MEIRELGEADATEYRELRLRALREHPESFLSSYEAERARPETEVAARLARSAESPDDFILGCYVDDELVGMIGFSRDDREKQRHRGFIWGMHAKMRVDSPAGRTSDSRSHRGLVKGAEPPWRGVWGAAPVTLLGAEGCLTQIPTLTAYRQSHRRT